MNFLLIIVSYLAVNSATWQDVTVDLHREKGIPQCKVLQ